MMTPLKLSLIVYLVSLTLSILATTPLYASSHHHIQNQKSCKPPYSILYVYTFPTQSECVLLTHNGHVVNASGVPIK
jgi:hypothetical protein